MLKLVLSVDFKAIGVMNSQHLKAQVTLTTLEEEHPFIYNRFLKTCSGSIGLENGFLLLFVTAFQNNL